TKKMSKSDENVRGFISMLDTPKQMEKKIKSAVTDSDGTIAYDTENKPGVSNLLSLYSALTNQSIDASVDHFSGKRYGAFKTEIAAAGIDTLIPSQERYKGLIHSSELDEILAEGAKKASATASQTLNKAKQKMGLGK